MIRLIVAVLLIVSTSAAADIYRYKDSNGNWVYSDTPSPGAERVDVVVYNDVGAPVSTDDSQPQEIDSTPSDEAVTYSLSINTPAHDSTVTPGEESLMITATLSPATPPGTTFRLYANGTPQLEGNRPSFELTGLIRGELVLYVEAFDQEGESIAESAPVTVHVHRASARTRATPMGGGMGAGSIGNNTRPRQQQ